MFAASRLTAPCCLLASVLACDPRLELDEGADLCVSRTDTPQYPGNPIDADQDFAADEPVLVTVIVTHGGEPILDYSCEIDVDPDARTLTVHTQFRLGRDTGNDILTFSETRCTSDPLPAGTYTVVYADHEAALAVPGRQPPICFEHARH